MEIERDSTSERCLWLDVLILAACFGLFFFALGDRLLWGSEGRWAEITREMMLTGDYFHPTINGEPYFDKPLFTYWFIAGIAMVAGKLNELVVRLPSAIMGLAAVWATLRLGSRLWSPAVGRIAACIVMTCYGVVLWSRSGAADTENMATVILCTLWYWSRRDKLNFTALLVLYLAAFIGSHMKGPVAAVVTALVILPDLFGEKVWKSKASMGVFFALCAVAFAGVGLRGYFTCSVVVLALAPLTLADGRWKAFVKPSALLALAIGLAVFFIPFMWAAKTNPATYGSSGLALVWQENVQRFTSPIDHKNSVFTYVWSVPILLLPWAPLFICALIAAVKEWKGLDANTRWLLKAMALVFIFFTLAGSRRNYYILPIVPFCALLAAALWVRVKEAASAPIVQLGFDIQKHLLYGAAVVELIAGTVFLVVPLKKTGVSLASVCLASIIVAIAALLAGIAVSWGLSRLHISRQEKLLLPLAAVAAVVMGGFFCVQQAVLEDCRSERQFVSELRRNTSSLQASRIALLQKGEADAKMIFYLGKESPVTLLRYNSRETDKAKLAADAQSVALFLGSPLPGALIAQARYAADLPTECRSLLAQAPDLKEKPMPFESKSAKGESWEAWFLNAADVASDRRQN
jgi:4-amino-4-deoxy-L-arabinose transferase-like glycosyltransferase